MCRSIMSRKSKTAMTLQLKMTSPGKNCVLRFKSQERTLAMPRFLDIMKAFRLSSPWRGKTKTGQNRMEVPVLSRSCRVLRCRPLRNLRLVLPSGLR
jgi:hypothetical protein